MMQDIEPRRALLSVIVHDVPPPVPRPGATVEVVLDGIPENAITGRVMEGIGMGYGVIRVMIPGKLPEVLK